MSVRLLGMLINAEQ